MSPFKEAHQFKGVHPDPALVEASNRPGIDAETAAKLRRQPALDRSVSMHFSDGTFFDVQEDDSGQYLVMAEGPGRVRERCYEGDWVVQMPSGKFKVLSNTDYLDMGGTTT
jgi:hypothetical protein